MWNPKPLILLVVLSLSISTLPSPCTAATGGGKPLVTAVTKDASTSLYTAPLKAGQPLVLDLTSPLISLTTCPSKSKTGTVTTTTLTANATDGQNPLFPVSFSATATCGTPPPSSLKLPAGAVGVAGLAPGTQSFPAQVARTQKVADKIALCLPSDGKSTSGDSVGAAIFGGGPFFFPDRGDFTTNLAGTAALRQGLNGAPGFFVSATGIAVDGNRLTTTGSGELVVQLSSTVPYTAVRSDVYGALLRAFDAAATGPKTSYPWMKRVAAVAPFERCYDSTKLEQSLSGYSVPNIDVMLEGGGNFTVVGGNSMVQVNGNTACLGFVKGEGTAAVVIGGFQMENRLLVLDVEKKQLGFTNFLGGVGLSCSNFNFTLAG